MTNVLTYPEYIGGTEQNRSKRAYTRPENVPLSHDILLMFVSACAVSACVTLAFLVFRFAHVDEEVYALQNYDYAVDNTPHTAPSRFQGGRQAFLAGMLSDRAYTLKTQVNFIASIITSHFKNHPQPEQLAYVIVSESLRANYDPLFVAAVIRSESTFRHTVVSDKGAQGLMQIMPETGQYVSKLQNLKWSGVRMLHDPNTNLRLGIAYLKYLEDKFKGNRERVLVAYNWGPANLDQALKNRLPVPSEPLQYARKIISAHRVWKNELTQLAANQNRGLLARVLG
jgi:soluble lytic murein transglycosylase-like protein